MRLSTLLNDDGIDPAVGALTVSGISADTRRVKAGDLFFIIEGDSHDVYSLIEGIKDVPLAFVADARRKERVDAVLRGTCVIFVDDVRSVFQESIERFYPLKELPLTFIGVTGTNGKTTISHLIRYLLGALGNPCALLGTNGYNIGKRHIPASLTTPDSLTLHVLFSQAADEGARFAVMEVSSHGIVQDRIAGIPFSQCIFTNLSRDHLDYHGAMDEYYAAKRSLFKTNPQAVSLINTDDAYGKRLYEETAGEKYSVGFSDTAAFRASAVTCGRRGSSFMVEALSESIPVKSPLIGRYNVLNVLTALCSVAVLGFPLAEAVRHLRSFGGIEGRLQEVGDDVFIDYAHTPDALCKSIAALRESGYEDCILVFGCGGNRDRGKRPLMGAVAARDTCHTIITSDNPRDEDPDEICRDILTGCEGGSVEVIADRASAIRKAVRLKEEYKNAVVLVAGKGHEPYQLIKGERIPFKDKEAVRQALGRQKHHAYPQALDTEE